MDEITVLEKVLGGFYIALCILIFLMLALGVTRAHDLPGPPTVVVNEVADGRLSWMPVPGLLENACWYKVEERRKGLVGRWRPKIHSVINTRKVSIPVVFGSNRGYQVKTCCWVYHDEVCSEPVGPAG